MSCNQKSEKGMEIKKMTSDDSLKIQLIGKWGDREAKNDPALKIMPDSIYFYDHSKAYSYKIVNGNMIIDLPTKVDTFRNVSVKNDTMFYLMMATDIQVIAERLPD